MTQTNLNSLILFNYLQYLVNYNQLCAISLYQSSSNLQSIYNNNNSSINNGNVDQHELPLITNQSLPLKDNLQMPQQNNNVNVVNDITPVVNVNKPKRKRNKKRRSTYLVTKCPHKGAKHYAKNMCSTCYHSKGRNKPAWKCEHTDQPHYALGLCQVCYQVNYFQRKKKIEFEKCNRNNNNN